VAKGNLPVLLICDNLSPVTSLVEPLLLYIAELAVRDWSRLVVRRNVLRVRIIEYRN
jgi:hypothetical protein